MTTFHFDTEGKDSRREELEELTRPLIKWLNNNYHPHVKVIVDPTSAELVEGVSSFCTVDYIKD